MKPYIRPLTFALAISCGVLFVCMLGTAALAGSGVGTFRFGPSPFWLFEIEHTIVNETSNVALRPGLGVIVAFGFAIAYALVVTRARLRKIGA